MTLYAGLMSGTSMDGVDAVVAGDRDAGMPGPRRACTLDYPARACSRRLQSAGGRSRGPVDLDELGELDAAVGDVFAAAAMRLLEFSGFSAAQIRAIGSHGQTLLHRPRGAAAFTLQIGDANRIAERTGIDVVADFRRRDVAAGGEGAPLVPGIPRGGIRSPGERRAWWPTSAASRTSPCWMPMAA